MSSFRLGAYRRRVIVALFCVLCWMLISCKASAASEKAEAVLFGCDDDVVAIDENVWQAMSSPAKLVALRFRIHNTCAQEQVLMLNTSITHAKVLRIQIDQGAGQETILDINAASSFYDRPINSRVLVVPVALAGFQEIDVYVEYGSIANYPLFLSLYNDDYRRGLKSFFDWANGVFFGAIFVLVLFFFLQFIIKPSKALGYYCLLVLSVGLFVGQITGYCFHFLWPEQGLFNTRFSAVAGGLTYLWYFLFSSALFGLSEWNKTLHRLVLLVATILTAVIVVGLFVDVTLILALLAMVALPLPLIVGIWALRRRMPSAFLFVIGSALHFSFTYLFTLSVMGWDLGLQRSIFGLVGLGQLIDICLFAGALIYQSKVVREDLQKVLEQKLSDAKALAELEREKNRSMSKLQDKILQLAAASHDMTQPLASMKMALAVVDDQHSGAAKEKMQTAIRYTEELLRSIITSSQEDYFRSDERVDIASIFQALLERHRDVAAARRLSLRIAHAHQRIQVSPVVIHRVLDNLVVNAIRYTERGGVLVSARTRKDGVLLQVWDTGRGMPQEVMQAVNRPFKHHQNEASPAQGFGLGMYIVQSLCVNAGWHFSVKTMAKKGSCCSVFIKSDEETGLLAPE